MGLVVRKSGQPAEVSHPIELYFHAEHLKAVKVTFFSVQPFMFGFQQPGDGFSCEYLGYVHD